MTSSCSLKRASPITSITVYACICTYSAIGLRCYSNRFQIIVHKSFVNWWHPEGATWLLGKKCPNLQWQHAVGRLEQPFNGSLQNRWVCFKCPKYWASIFMHVPWTRWERTLVSNYLKTDADVSDVKSGCRVVARVPVSATPKHVNHCDLLGGWLFVLGGLNMVQATAMVF